MDDGVEMVGGGGAQPQAALGRASGHPPVEPLQIARLQLHQRLGGELGAEEVDLHVAGVEVDRCGLQPLPPRPGDRRPASHSWSQAPKVSRA